MVEGETSFFHGIGNGHSLEVPAMVNSAGLSVDQRIVGS